MILIISEGSIVLFWYDKIEAKKMVLPEPWTNITIDFEAIIKAFQDLGYIGELRQRWNEIKRLQNARFAFSS